MYIDVVLKGHGQRIKFLEREMRAMKDMQKEIRSMNETLVTLVNEIKHANEHLVKHWS